jgi:hypothetical protein
MFVTVDLRRWCSAQFATLCLLFHQLDAVACRKCATELLRDRPMRSAEFGSPHTKRSAPYETEDAAIDPAYTPIQPEVTTRRLARSDRERGLAQLAGVAATAAACTFRSRDSVLGLQWLDQGRGVLLSQVFESSSDLTSLGQDHPELASLVTFGGYRCRWSDRLIEPSHRAGLRG